MLKFILLILKNLKRNRLRTALTALAVVVLVILCVEMGTIVVAVEKMVGANGSQSRLMVTERWVWPSRIPARYVPALSRVEGVEDWTVWHTYPGFVSEKRQVSQQVFGVATRAENIVAMHSGLEKLDPAVIETLKRERYGAIVAADIAQEFGCRVGQPITLFSAASVLQSLRLKVVGVLPSGVYQRVIFFRSDYFESATGNKDTVDIVWLRARDPESAQRVTKAVQERFSSGQTELKIETESAGVARFASRSQALMSLIQLVIAILLADMVIVLSNSISVATRERRVEMAVLKVLGFEPRAIMLLVIGEAMLIGAASGLAGSALAWGFSALALNGLLPWPGLTEMFNLFPISALAIPAGGMLGALVGLAGSLLPAWNARGVKVTNVFAKIA